MCYNFLIVIVVLRIGGTSVSCSLKVADIKGEPGKSCHTFNYGIHLAQDFVHGLQTEELCAALHSSNDTHA